MCAFGETLLDEIRSQLIASYKIVGLMICFLQVNLKGGKEPINEEVSKVLFFIQQNLPIIFRFQFTRLGFISFLFLSTYYAWGT